MWQLYSWIFQSCVQSTVGPFFPGHGVVQWRVCVNGPLYNSFCSQWFITLIPPTVLWCCRFDIGNDIQSVKSHSGNIQRFSKARYTVSTKLNATRSTLLKVDRVALARYTLATQSKGRSTFRWQSWPYRQQSQPYRRQSTLSPVLATVNLSPVCTKLKRTWPHLQKTGH